MVDWEGVGHFQMAKHKHIYFHHSDNLLSEPRYTKQFAYAFLSHFNWRQLFQLDWLSYTEDDDVVNRIQVPQTICL